MFKSNAKVCVTVTTADGEVLERAWITPHSGRVPEGTDIVLAHHVMEHLGNRFEVEER